MRAVGVHCFAGGMIMGVRQAGFELEASYEPLGFGVETQRERLGVDVRAIGVDDVDDWPLPGFTPDLVIGNPRCGGFGSLGANSAGADARGGECRQSRDAEQLVQFGLRTRARAIVLESVQTILQGSNRVFVDRLVRDLLVPEGYHVWHVLMSTAWLGNPQRRRRYFLLAMRDRRCPDFESPSPPERAVVVGDVLGELVARDARPGRLLRSGAEYDEDVYNDYGEEVERLYCHLQQGDTVNSLLHRHGAR